MGKTTIEWTQGDDGTLGKTWNPVRGCSRVSQGCVNCYAERQALRFVDRKDPADSRIISPGPFRGFVSKVNGHASWTGKVELVEKHLYDPLHWREPKRIFVNSMSDLFHEALPDEAIDRVFAVMALCPQHTFQVLTKRPERMLEYLRAPRRAQMIEHVVYGWHESQESTGYRLSNVLPVHPLKVGNDLGNLLERPRWPLPNVWLGVSVEDQPTADERIQRLLQTPAAVRFVSYEPALAGVDFARWFDEGLECNYCERWRGTESTAKPDGNEEDPGFLCPNCGEACAHLPWDEILDWIIVGGESGPDARPFNIQWARNTVAQCKAAGVACFVKQLGSNARTEAIKGYRDAMARLEFSDRKGGDWYEWPDDLKVREFPNVR